MYELEKESENKKTCATKEHKKPVQLFISPSSATHVDEMISNTTLYRNRQQVVEVAIEKLYNSFKKSK